MRFIEKQRSAAGFTILEMVIVLTVISIILAISVPMYQKHLLQAKETTLKLNLRLMREQIDKYAADREESPDSLEALVQAGYLREIPIDPITESRDTWEVTMEEEPLSPNGKVGIKDVFSGAEGSGSDGRSYKEW